MAPALKQRNWWIRRAAKEDAEAIHALIVELARYEEAPDEVEVTVGELREHGFGEKERFICWVAEDASGVFGCALAYEKYSTWKGPCLFLEDLIVRQSDRGRGAGKALFESVAQHAAVQQFRRMEWQVLDWNAPAIGFYKSMGAALDPTWINGKLTGTVLAQYAHFPPYTP
jgi:GNAT superfamily N-acetyltransferase